jgi:hypothetical protein
VHGHCGEARRHPRCCRSGGHGRSNFLPKKISLSLLAACNLGGEMFCLYTYPSTTRYTHLPGHLFLMPPGMSRAAEKAKAKGRLSDYKMLVLVVPPTAFTCVPCALYIRCRRACPTTLSLYIHTHRLCPIPGLQHAIPDSCPTNQREAVSLRRPPGRLVNGKRRLGGCGAQAATGLRLGIPLSREEGGYPCSSTQVPSPPVGRRRWWV